MSKSIPRILITPGEPAGIGPDILLKIAAQAFAAEVIAVCDPNLLEERAALLKLPIKLLPFNGKKNPTRHIPNSLKILSIPLATACIPGKLNPDNSSYVMNCLTVATDYCLENKADALVTGPVNKSIINIAGIPFIGHTEFLAARCHTEKVLMLFVVNQIKVALATTHIPLGQVPKAITIAHLTETIQLLHTELQHRFDIKTPRIFVAGLNPHAGEEGLLGREEINIIIPAINQLRIEGIEVAGPFPADTLFMEKYFTQCDAILAMYHDQALPVVKYMGFDSAVNVTLGLPIIRTSVDHGTALSIAGTNQADAGSLNAAMHLAITLHARSAKLM